MQSTVVSNSQLNMAAMTFSSPTAPLSAKSSLLASPASNKSTSTTLPRRFRTAFILYSAVRHKQVREELGRNGKKEKTANIAKLVARDWRSLDATERDVWFEKARQDKARYDAEMLQYNPTQALPKRPMSAYLAFSNERRGALKRMLPKADNRDLSRRLAKIWKEAPPEVKEPYFEEESRLRAKYIRDMQPFKAAQKKQKQAKNHHDATAAVSSHPEQQLQQQQQQVITNPRGERTLLAHSTPVLHHPNHHNHQPGLAMLPQLVLPACDLSSTSSLGVAGNQTSSFVTSSSSRISVALARAILQEEAVRRRQEQQQQQQLVALRQLTLELQYRDHLERILLAGSNTPIPRQLHVVGGNSGVAPMLLSRRSTMKEQPQQPPKQEEDFMTAAQSRLYHAVTGNNNMAGGGAAGGGAATQPQATTNSSTTSWTV